MAVIRDGDWTLDHELSDIKLGRFVWYLHTPDGQTVVRTDYRADPTIEANKAQRNMSERGWKGDYHLVASIPPNVFYDQLAEASRQGDEKYVARWLNDSDHAAWRTKEGRL